MVRSASGFTIKTIEVGDLKRDKKQKFNFSIIEVIFKSPISLILGKNHVKKEKHAIQSF